MGSRINVLVDEGLSLFTFPGLQIEEYAQEAVYAEDNIHAIGQKFRIVGTCIVECGGAGNDYETLRDSLKASNNRVYQVSIYGLTGVNDELFDATKLNDDTGGPFVKISATHIYGANTAILRFEVTSQRSYVDSQTVTSHRWTQRMSMDAAGHVTRTINGTLTVARGTSGSSTTAATKAVWQGKEAYADLFRRAIVPPVIGEGWRRESQDFALDSNSTMLTYSIVDKRLAYDLPDGVMVGDMEFSIERGINHSTYAVAKFSCDLEGSLDLKDISGTTPNRKLIEAAVQLSKLRLNVDYKNTIVQNLRVTEKNLLSGFAIRYEMEAWITAASNPEQSGILTIPYMIGQKFTITRSVSRSVDSYGPAVTPTGSLEGPIAYGMMPHWLANEIDGITPVDVEATEMPQATLFSVTGSNTFGTVTVAVVAGTSGVAAMNELFSGAFQGVQKQPARDAENYATIVPRTTSVTHTEYDSGIVRLSPMYVDTADFVFQTKKPEVRVRERVEVSRANQAPPKEIRPLPTNAYVKSEDWRVTSGKFDAQGQRMFTGIFERDYTLYDSGGVSGVGFYTFTTPGGADLRAWGAPNETLLGTYSPTAYNEGNAPGSSVFANATDTRQMYNVPPEDYVT
jgi:hypothetical protein